MASTLAGVFDDFDDAERARERLTSAGFRRESIRVTPERSAWGTGDATYGGSAKREGGLRGFFAELFGIGDDKSHEHYSEAVRRGSVVVSVEADDERQMARATEILEDCGAIDVDERVERWKAAGYQGYDEQAKPLTREEIARDRQTLDVIQDAVVERRPVDRPATSADIAAFKEGEMEIRETAEEPVVSKNARVVEEVDIGKEANQRTETVSDTVRRTDVDVERAGGAAQPKRAKRYSGIERRKSFGNYTGAERRVGR